MPEMPGHAPALGYNQYQGQDQQNYLFPEEWRYYLDLAERTFDRDTAHMGWEEKEEVRQFDANLRKTMEQLEMQYKQAVEVARIYAGADNAQAQATVAAASEHARAAVEAAQIAANASKYDADTRLQIAREANQVAREGLQLEGARIRAEEMGRPSEWPQQIAFGMGWKPEQAGQLHQGILEGIESAISGIGAGAPGQAVVGEAGPELATATPQGTLISPLTRTYTPGTNRTGSWAPPVPRMAGGGWLRTDIGGGGYGRKALAAQGWTDVPVGGPGPQRGGWKPTPVGTSTQGTTPAGNTTAISGTGSYNPAWGGYVNPATSAAWQAGGMPNVAGRAHMRARMQDVVGTSPIGMPAALRIENAAPGSRPAYGLAPGAAGVADLRARLLGGYGAGVSGAGQPGTPGTPGQPPSAPPATPTDLLIAGLMQPNQPAFGTWTGPTTNPALGVTQDVRQPSSYNLGEWNSLSYEKKAYLAGLWRSLGMIAGENEAEVMANAEAKIRSSAWTGGAPAVPSYGGW